ncbi:MAG: AAA family ATPase, partial [Planctomycetes bacterium]|nr:AAA family ATPase [Planctomycetota bacterium]
MRILAIRGQNLASLQRPFEIRLDAPPLGATGLFAIVGPVGAGKSTLLDALCLPLFDRTPRLSGRGGPAVGDDNQPEGDWLGSNDPRILLRRGAPDGFAEVDFVGRDGVRYRARWRVRRARRKPDGRVQDQELELRELDGDAVVASGRKTDVLAAIQLRLGLDFAQFCRSVLLAQGDFAAFLRANAKERAQLLETLTGADVYRALSKAAHEKRRRLQQDRELLIAQMQGQQGLDPDQRAGLEAKIANRRAEIAVAEQGIELAQSYVNWYQQAARHARRESEATVSLQKAQAANLAAEPDRRHLAELQRALPLAGQAALVVDRRGRLQRAESAQANAAAAVVAAE